MAIYLYSVNFSSFIMYADKSGYQQRRSSMDVYLENIGRYTLLTPEKEVILAKRVKAGDQNALEELVNSNLRFVVSVAKQYQNKGLSFGDLINEGNLGMIKAAERFDETRGFRFISYAVWWIKQSILQSLAENSRIVRQPLSVSGALNKLGKAHSRLEQKYGREPTRDELEEIQSLLPDYLKHFSSGAGKTVYLDEPFEAGNEDGNSLVNLLEQKAERSPDERLINESLKTEIIDALERLPYREAEVVKLYFGIGMERPLTLEEIGEKITITKERVRQLKEKAIRRLRHINVSGRLREYL
jgi:RNA polymerase primary sigma factor